MLARQLRAEAAETRGLVRDHAAAGLLDGRADRIDVERRHGAHVDDLGVDVELLRRRLADVDHRAVGDDGHLLARPHDLALADRHLVVTLGHLALGVRAPRHRGLVGVAVERSVVDALGLEEDDRVVVFDGRDQQALGVVGIAGHHHFHAADVREDRLGTLRMRLAAADAAAAGRADHHGRGEIAGAAIADARELARDLVHGRIDVVGELDFGDGLRAR